jgi:hypothetical protein
MAEQVWGTGYGSKRHLVNPDTRKDEPARRYGRDRYAEAACSNAIYLSFFSDGTQEGEGEAVMNKPACPRCTKKAGKRVCPTCKGAGMVE